MLMHCLGEQSSARHCRCIRNHVIYLYLVGVTSDHRVLLFVQCSCDVVETGSAWH